MKKRAGFTLLEIMIVVAIVGLLAGLVAFNINKAVQNSRLKTAQTELELISAGILKLAWDTGRWPNGAWRQEGASGMNEIWSLEGSGLDSGTGYDDWEGPYYEGSYEDPWGNPYFFDSDYQYEGKVRIAAGSFGPNRVGRNVYDSDNVIVLLDD